MCYPPAARGVRAGWGTLGEVRERRDCLKVQAQGAHFSGHACSEVLQCSIRWHYQTLMGREALGSVFQDGSGG